jgi:SAM-dependent methyltransferase
MADRKAEWFDQESFWVDLFPAMFPPARLEAAAEEAEKIVSLTAFQGTTVLDLCCGPGRHSVAMAKRGLRVTGVDRSDFFLAKARDRALAEGVTVEWVQSDMRDFERPDSFELALSMFTSFGYFDAKEEDQRVLASICRSLKPDGTLLIDVMGKERLAKILLATTSQTLPDGSLLIQRHEIFDDWTRIRNEWVLIRDGLAKTYRFHHTIYSGQELRDRLCWAGFASVCLYGDLAGTPYGPDAPRLVAVARKARQ